MRFKATEAVMRGAPGSRRRNHWVLRVCTVVAALAAVNLATNSTSLALAQGTLKMIPHASLNVLDPIWTTAYISRNHGYLVYDTLFAMDEQFKIRPQMVDTYQVSADKLTYRFTLRKGLKWHDGTPVTSRDCIASIRRWGAKDALGQKLMAATQDLKAVNDATFTLTLRQPFGLVLEALGKPSSTVPFMMPERIALTDPNKAITDATGSGPFRFVKEEFVPGVKAVYVRNPDYVPRNEPPSFMAGGKLAYLDRVEWVYVPDYNTAIAAVAAGEYDMVETVPPDLTSTVRDNPKVRVTPAEQGQLIMRVNHLQPPFDNVKNRRALYYLIDQKEYLAATVGGPEWYRPCWALFGCAGPYASNSGAEDFKPDLDQAKRLLKEGGYHGEPIVVMDATDLYIAHSPALVTAQRLRQAGMNVVLQSMDWSTLVNRRAEKKSVAEGGWSIFHTFANTLDQLLPITNGQLNGGCDKAWFGWYCDPRIEELRDKWLQTSDPGQQHALAIQIQQRGYEQGAYVLLGEMTQARVVSSRVSGVKGPIPVFWGVKIQ